MPNMTPIFMRNWLVKITDVLDLLMAEVSFRRACDIMRACTPMLGSPISPSISESAVDAEAIIREEVDRMMARLKERSVVPTIVGLQEQLESVRAAEVARMRGKLGTLTPEQEQALEALTRSIINKIAHGPISELRRHATQPDGHHFVAASPKVFRFGE